MKLFRHGEMTGNPFVCPERPVSGCLSELGIQQAEQARNHHADWPCDIVFASSFGRALQTAEILFADRGVDIEILPFLHEWMPTQDGEAAQADAMPHNRELYVEETWKTTAGEGCFDMFARIGPPFLLAFAKYGIHARHGGYHFDPGAEDLNVAVVAHGGTLNVLLSFLLNLPPKPMGYFGYELTGCAQVTFERFCDVWHPKLRIGA